ncbi:MAG: hypothetical protein ABIZ95_18255 [Pyrinomonadaceae bacterium]
MKKCPQCQREYSDNSLRFCLDDGAVLENIGSSSRSAAATEVFSRGSTAAGSRATVPVGQAAYGTPSNAGRALSIVALLLVFGSIALFFTGFFASALKANESVVGGLILFSLPGAGLGTIIALIGLYRAYRAADGQGAKKMAIFAVLLNVIFMAGVAILLLLGLAITMT